MKSRLSLIFAALVVLLGAMVWVVQDRKAVAPTQALAEAPVLTSAPVVAAEFALAAAPAIIPASSVNAGVEPAANQAVPAPTPATSVLLVTPPAPLGQSSPVVRVTASGDVKYVAREGDTVSQLAIALLGSDSKEHRDAVIAANPLLKSNPDLVLAGQTYVMATPAVQAVGGSSDQQTTAVASAAIVAAQPQEKSLNRKPGSYENPTVAAAAPKLTYSAQRGDTVRVLAADLLGGDTKANRDAIIAGNVSLQEDPDHLVAGNSYIISAPNGLAADPTAPQAKAPTSQPDADDVLRLGLGRTLRYTAQPGDTVAKLAIALMGSDTPANRDLIIKNNPSLKLDPDHLSAGKVYWIAAPTVESKP